MNNKPLGRVVFLHGLRTDAKNRRVNRLARYFHLEGFTVVIPAYGYIPLFLAGMTYWFDRRIANFLSVFIEENDILVGHSNGATLVYMIAKRRRIKGAILINPALKPNLAPHAGWVHIYYNEGDWITGISGLVPFHLWGSMGRDGYQGTNPNVLSIDQAHPPSTALPPLYGHSDVFEGTHLRPWAQWMARLARKAGERPQ